MATYKVIQDIEAEDKLFGPLTAKQFIFAGITVICGYLCFWAIANELPFLIVLFLPPGLFFGILAAPWSKDQPTEVWMAAKLRFYFRPRRRIWDQSGIKELVTITAPKKEEHAYTDGLDNTQVRSRLRALADTIDSRGWAVKGSGVNIPAQPSYYANQSDRLVETSSMPQQVSEFSLTDADDMLDPVNNREATKLGTMIQQSDDQHHDEVRQKINEARNGTPQTQVPPPPPSPPGQNPETANDYWFMRQPSAPTNPGSATFEAAPLVAPRSAPEPKNTPAKELSDEERTILDKIHKNQEQPNPMNSHLKTIKPLSQQQEEEKEAQNRKKMQETAEAKQENAGTPSPQTAKADTIRLANNNDRSVESIAREANKPTEEPPADEVVVSLH